MKPEQVAGQTEIRTHCKKSGAIQRRQVGRFSGAYKICTHIIAVVSRETALSWWVPFEIGEATALERRISTYQTGYAQLPEYLAKWPIMTTDFHLQYYHSSF